MAEEEVVKMKRSDIANLTGGIETVDGRTLYGMDAENYIKMQMKMDPELERKCGEWIEDLLEIKLEDPNDLYTSLKDGTVLIEVANKIMPGIIVRWNKKKSPSDKLHVLWERGNIDLFLEACWKLGVESEDIFVTADLHSRKGMQSVFNNLAALSRVASNYGITDPKPIGPGAPKKRTGPPKWDLNFRTGPIHVGEVEFEAETPEEIITRLIKELESAQQKVSSLESVNQGLKNDMKDAREKLLLAKTEFVFDDQSGASEADIEKVDILKSKLHEMQKDMESTIANMELLKDELNLEKSKQQMAQTQIEDLNQIIQALRSSRKGVALVHNPHNDKDESGLLEVIKNKITEIMTNPSKELTEELENKILSNDTGRRIFAFQINEYVDKEAKDSNTKEIELTQDSFNSCLELCNKALNKMDIQNGADFISAKHFMTISYQIYTLDGENKKFLHDLLEDCPIWKSHAFWEELFWGRTAALLPKSEGQEDGYTEEQKKIILQQLESCADGMHAWGKIPLDEITNFVNTVAESLNFDDKDKAYIKQKLSQYETITTRGRRSSFISNARISEGGVLKRLASTKDNISPSESNSDLLIKFAQEKTELLSQIQQLKLLESTVNALKQELQSSQKKVQQNQALVANYEKTVEDLTEKLKSQEATTALLQTKLLAERKEKLKVNKAEQDKQNEQNDLLQKKIKEKDEQIEKIKLELINRIHDKDKAIKDQKDKLNQKDEEIKKIKKEKEEFQNDRIRSRSSSFVRKEDEKDIMIQAAEEELEQQEAKIEKQTLEIERLTKKLEKREDSLKGEREKNKRLEEGSGWEVELEEKQALLQAAEEELEQQEKIINEQKEEIISLQQMLKSAKREREELNIIVEDYRVKLNAANNPRGRDSENEFLIPKEQQKEESCCVIL